MVDAAKIAPKAGHYRTDGIGWCYRKAGWRHVGFTQEKGLHVFQQLPEWDMPEAEPVTGTQAPLFEFAAPAMTLRRTRTPAPGQARIANPTRPGTGMTERMTTA